MDTSPDPTLPTSWQLWDLILIHLHNPPIARIVIEGYKRVVSQSGSYFNHDLYYASDDIPNGKLSYIRLQDNLPQSLIQNCILPPLDCLENQIDVLASLLVERFERNGICQIFIHHEPASLAMKHDIARFVTSRCKGLGYDGTIDVTLEQRPRLPTILPLLPEVSQVPRHYDGISLHIGWQTAWPSVEDLDEGFHLCKDELSKPRWWHALDDIVRRVVNENA